MYIALWYDVLLLGKNYIYIWINFSKHSGSIIIQEHKNLRENPLFLKKKITGQTPNNFNVLDRDYNTYQKKFSFSFHLLLSFSLYISHHFFLLFLFFSVLPALTHAVLQDCTSPQTLEVHYRMAFPFYFFHLFFLSSFHTLRIKSQ